MIRHAPAVEEAVVEPSGWFSVQLRYAYLVGEPATASMVEDRVILVEATDEEAALGHAVERAPEYEDDFETDDSEAGAIRFQGIVAIKELDDGPRNGTEVWHEFMSPQPGGATDDEGDPLPPVWPQEMAFPRATDD
ncbi:MAG: DUF4288 domain-containing protein [Chloroflexota bacterium]